MNSTMKARSAGEKGHRGPPPLHPIMKAVAAQALQFLPLHMGYINRADLDDPFQRRDGGDLGQKLLDHHGGRVRLIRVNLPGPRPGVPCYDLANLTDLQTMADRARDAIKRRAGGRYFWWAVEQTEVVDVFQGEWDAQGDPVLNQIGTGPHAVGIVGADHELLDDLAPDWQQIRTHISKVGSFIRYNRKGYDSRLNSELLNYRKGKFIPPNPVMLALAVMAREALRSQLVMEKFNKKRTSKNFPTMQNTGHRPRAKKGTTAAGGTG